MLVEIVAGFIATLIATLIGVFAAFQLDTKVQDIARKRRVLETLKALRKELRINQDLAHGTSVVMRRFKERSLKDDADHYVVDLFNVDAWEAAVAGQVETEIETGLYFDLQDHYSEVRSTNELIRRLKFESLHPTIGDEKGSGGYSRKIWTTSLEYWHHDNEEVDFLGLGPLLGNEARDIETDSRDLTERLTDEIQRLESELPDEDSYWGYLVGIKR